ncbi:MAG: efflux RND transporter periplasmic adaptor subunit [Bacteroidia bacterium]
MTIFSNPTRNAFFIASILLYTSCGEKKQQMAIVPDVNVVTAAQRTLPVYSEFIGQTYGQSDIDIQPRVEGWVTGIHFKEGDKVKKGQLLYTIDEIQLRNKVASAQAGVAEAEVMVQKTKADLDRVEPLAKMKALSERDLDAAKAAYDGQQQRLESAKAMLNNSQVELGYTHINAPISGVIGISKVQEGDYVSRSIGKNVINTISAVGAMRVRFSISENEYLQFKKKAEKGATKEAIVVEMVLGDGSLFPEKGKIDFADRTIDPETGSLLVQAVFQNSNGLLKPGQYAKIRFVTDIVNDAVIVPQQAINQLQNIYQVFVVENNKIIPRPVEVGMRIGSNWVISKGLKAGEKVAVIGNAVVKPEMTIKPVDMNWNYDSTGVR